MTALSMYIHRLVAAAFLGEPPSLLHTQVNHKDGDRGNNALSNLEYATPEANAADRWARSSNVGRCTSAVKPVMSRIQGNNEGWATYPAIISAAKQLGVDQPSVSMGGAGRQVAMSSDWQRQLPLHLQCSPEKSGGRLTLMLIFETEPLDSRC